MIEPPLLFTSIQILPDVLIKRVITGFLVANVKICRTAIALTNADKFDSDIGMLPEKVSANNIVARWPGAWSGKADEQRSYTIRSPSANAAHHLTTIRRKSVSSISAAA
jgi:hypothetical protein